MLPSGCYKVCGRVTRILCLCSGYKKKEEKKAKETCGYIALSTNSINENQKPMKRIISL